MGVDTRKPLLPAPTESSVVDTTGDSATPTDLATDISRRTDKTSYSIPDDGSPITISTRDRSRQRADEGKISRTSHQSQTSLLIEYFEGGKGPNLNSRPSVRVKVTPSSARKNKDRDDHIQISEGGGNRKPSYSRRISLGTPSRTKQLPEPGTDDRSISSLASVADDPNQTGRRPPLEIEFLNRDQGSELSSNSNARYIQPTSDISSMPPESTLDTALTLRSKRSRSLDREDMHDSQDTLKAPSRRRSRSLSRERIAHKAAEKLSSAPREVTGTKPRRRHRNASKELLESDVKSPRKRSGKHREDDIASPESSLLTNSALSSQGKAGDRNSFRSGTSKSSINNPKLLETVEDAIRRLILPELSELKKDQKAHTNRSKFERDTTVSRGLGSSDSKTGLARRLSKHASAPDVTTPKVVLNQDSNDSLIPQEEQPKRRRHRRREDSESHGRKTSKDLAVPDEQLQRKKSKGLRDAEAAAIVGQTLTAAALKHHDSTSSMGKSPRRKRKSSSRRSSSRNEIPQINETEVIFQKHDVPPMPMRSEIDSELTRESLLSQRTAETTTPNQSPRIREVSRGSPGSNTPTKKPFGPRNGLGTRHSNLSNHELSVPGTPSDRSLRENNRSPLVNASPSGAAAASDLLNRQLEDEDAGYGGYSNQRGLSPIQSVASYKDDATDPEQETGRKVDSSESLSSANKGASKMEQRFSIDSLSSAPSTSLARSKRPMGGDIEAKNEAAQRNDEHATEVGYSEIDHWQEDEDGNDRDIDGYRYSYGDSNTSDPKIDLKHMTNYTDESLDGVAAGREVADGYAANPEYVHTPVAVESAIASLHELSVVDAKSLRSDKHSFSESLNRPQSTRELSVNGGGSPLKQRQDASSPEEKSFPQRMGATSPPQSVAESLDDDEQAEQPRMGATGLPGAGSPIPEIGHIPDSEESDINTNPSIIQGPIGGVSHENRDHWPYKPTPPRSTGNQFSPQPEHHDTQDLKGDVGQPDTYDQQYYPQSYDQTYGSKDLPPMDQTQVPYMPRNMVPTPPGAKDEGYISAANPRSPSVATPEPKNRGFGALDNNAPALFDSPSFGDDPFTGTHQRHLSGYSHGMPSPLYDSATGKGIDRIQSKDIVALMDHLTVRDAQRNARDTEILVTLVRSAAEMRNSFEDMKKFISQQDELLMESGEKQHEKTQKIIGGPRPQPASVPRAPRQPSTEDDGEDMRSKRRNVFKRALKGLSLKSSNDLTKIEDMLVQLLDEVEALRAGQEGRFMTQPTSINSNEQPRGGSLQDNYDPERQGSYHTAADLSGYLPDSSRTAGDSRTLGDRQESSHRVSPVMEGDEDLEQLNSREQQILDEHLTSENSRHQRGASVPLATPPRVPVAGGAHSNDTTPKKSTETSRKHKSSSSSFFPKISRWSKTTASSFGEGIRNTVQPGRKDQPSSEASRSGSDLAHGAYNTNDYYDPQGDDRLRSSCTLDQRQENRPPSPLIPSQVSDNPKYQAHRDSFNLQHPQPRQGPTGRYQSQLESQAQDFGSPISLNSEQWGSNPSLTRINANRQGGGAGHLSPISDGGYSEVSGLDAKSGPPRPPKISNDEPLVPQRPLSGSQQSYAEHVASRGSRYSGYERSNGSPARSSPTHTPPQRKPTGPRPITSSGQHNPEQSRYGSMSGRHRYSNGQNRIEENGY